VELRAEIGRVTGRHCLGGNRPCAGITSLPAAMRARGRVNRRIRRRRREAEAGRRRRVDGSSNYGSWKRGLRARLLLRVLTGCIDS